MHLHLAQNDEFDSENEVFTIDLIPNQNVQERFKFLDPNTKMTAVKCLQWMKIFKSDDAHCPEIFRKVFEINQSNKGMCPVILRHSDPIEIDQSAPRCHLARVSR